jgi:collagenase-like PrtC family protease
MNNKIEFLVPTNWQDDLIERLPKDKIVQIYGKLNTDFIGGGRLSVAIPFVSKRKVAAHISRIHRYDLKFNYLLNGTCIDNLEWTRRGQARIRRLLSWLVEIGVDSVTVSIPYLAELIKVSYPTFKIEVSSFAGVDTVQRARRWEGLGVDTITLASYKVNRDFELLKTIRNNTSCRLQLIANNCCLDSCIHYSYHGNISTHASQIFHKSKYTIVDPCKLLCVYLRLRYLDKIISSGWIRPEDISIYEGIGIDRIKLVDRQMTTEAICRIVKAYSERHYIGNLYDLFPGPSKSISFLWPNILKKLPFFFSQIPLFSRLLKMKKLVRPEKIFIDNQALNGFLNFFLAGKCTGACEECGYCKKIAKETIKVNSEYSNYILGIYEGEFRDIISGFTEKG